MKKVTGKPAQTAFDLAIQHYGSTSGIFTIIADNPDLDIAEEIEGVEVNIREENINPKVVKYLENTIITTY